jgi:hypothetical protein
LPSLFPFLNKQPVFTALDYEQNIITHAIARASDDFKVKIPMETEPGNNKLHFPIPASDFWFETSGALRIFEPSKMC